MNNLPNHSIPLLLVVVAHLDEPLILDLLLDRPDRLPYILLKPVLDLLYEHLRAHVINKLHELALDLLPQELHVLLERVLSVPLWETGKAIVFLKCRTHIGPARQRGDQVARVVQEVAESLQTLSKQIS